MLAAKALESLRICAGLPKLLLLNIALSTISTNVSSVGPFDFVFYTLLNYIYRKYAIFYLKEVCNILYIGGMQYSIYRKYVIFYL